MIDRKKLIAAILIGFFMVVTLYPKITASESEYDQRNPITPFSVN